MIGSNNATSKLLQSPSPPIEGVFYLNYTDENNNTFVSDGKYYICKISLVYSLLNLLPFIWMTL